MGVWGLRKYVASRGDVLQPYQLTNTKLVIDGNSLVHYLSERVVEFTNCDRFGGDYVTLHAFAVCFFDTLKKCKVVLLVT